MVGLYDVGLGGCRFAAVGTISPMEPISSVHDNLGFSLLYFGVSRAIAWINTLSLFTDRNGPAFLFANLSGNLSLTRFCWIWDLPSVIPATCDPLEL